LAFLPFRFGFYVLSATLQIKNASYAQGRYVA